ncbi:hypothetical protein EC957_001347 [Mortierella hygrophila]|uniref:Uncharacterized protein n=1 Tax=Mortierella hygrophila TaxID=979708 RepID=A0A9P6F4V5_9FUNG|nr:hypothetical protein EC957_001347 [Mortierella hygrophila]
MLSHHEKPGWEDTTTATPFEGPQQHQSHKDHKDHGTPTRQHTHKQKHQTSGSCDQVVPTTSSHSPPSSPLPLGLQKQNGTTDADTATLAREVTDMDSEDDHRRRYKQHPTGRIQGRSSAASDYGSGQHSARSAMQATAESATAARSRRKETGGSTRTTTTTTPEISRRPRFSLSTVVNPRAQVHSPGTATREAAVAVPMDVSTKTTNARSSRTIKESVATPRATKSTTSSLGGHVQPTTKSVSTTRISKSRSPTTITTTTTTTTRRVASTIITMGPHHDREHRKLATANASAAAASAHSTKTSSSSSRKERTTRASNLAPVTAEVGRATMSRGGGRQTEVEPTVERTNAITIPTAPEHNDNKNATMQHLSIAKPTTTTTTTLLPALQMEGDEDFVQDIISTPTGVAINSPSSKPSSPSTPPLAASAEIPHILSSPISSPIIVASRPKTPPPPYQTAILHNIPSSDMVHQTPDMPSITTCSPTKETAPIIQEQHENTEVYLAKPPAAVILSKTEASPVAGSKQSPGIAKSMTVTTVVSAPPTFLSRTPRIFRAMREASSPRVLGVQQQQQQPILTSQSEIKAARDQERPAEVPTTPGPTTMHRIKSEDLAAEEPAETRSTLPTTSTPTTIPDLVGAEEAPKPQPQPFRKNIWNGRMDKFTKTWSTPLSHEESIPTAQGNAPVRTGILAAMGANVSRAPLTKVKDPAVMRDLMVLAKERRASRTLCVAEDGASGFRSASIGGNQFRDRSRMQFEHRNDNDNDTPTTTNLTTNHNNTYSSLSTSAPSGKITFEDKKAFLKTQEMRRRSNLHRSRSFNTVDPPYYPFPSSPSPAPAQDPLSIDTRPGFPWKGRAATATPPIPAIRDSPPGDGVSHQQHQQYIGNIAPLLLPLLIVISYMVHTFDSTRHPFLPLLFFHFFILVRFHRFIFGVLDVFNVLGELGEFKDVTVIVPGSIVPSSVSFFCKWSPCSDDAAIVLAAPCQSDFYHWSIRTFFLLLHPDLQQPPPNTATIVDNVTFPPLARIVTRKEPEAGQKKAEGMGVYKQVLTDWLLRLDQLSTITSPSTGSSLYKDHSGLKREVEKIRWQHNVPSKSNNRSK